MASTPIEWLEFHAPQFTDAALATTAIEAAQDHVGVWGKRSPWGDQHAQAIGLVAAHILTLRAQAIASFAAAGGIGTGGGAASMSTGGISISWAGPQTGADTMSTWLAKTTYGQTVNDMLRRVVTTPIVAGEF